MRGDLTDVSNTLLQTASADQLHAAKEDVEALRVTASQLNAALQIAEARCADVERENFALRGELEVMLPHMEEVLADKASLEQQLSVATPQTTTHAHAQEVDELRRAFQAESDTWQQRLSEAQGKEAWLAQALRNAQAHIEQIQQPPPPPPPANLPRASPTPDAAAEVASLQLRAQTLTQQLASARDENSMLRSDAEESRRRVSVAEEALRMHEASAGRGLAGPSTQPWDTLLSLGDKKDDDPFSTMEAGVNAAGGGVNSRRAFASLTASLKAVPALNHPAVLAAASYLDHLFVVLATRPRLRIIALSIMLMLSIHSIAAFLHIVPC